MPGNIGERAANDRKYALIRRSLLIAALAIAGTAVPRHAHAADIKIIYKSCPEDSHFDGRASGERKNCSNSTAKVSAGRLVLGLSGPIATGDTKRLQQTIDRHVARVQAFGYDGTGTFVTVVMSGSDGAFDEAVRLGRFFKDASVHTLIARGTRCSGACALAFMGGTALWGRLDRPTIERHLETGGALAFDSPFSLARTGEKTGPARESPASLRDVAATLNAYAMDVQIAPPLVGKMLQLAGARRLPVNSVFWAKIAEIAVDGAQPPPRVTDDNHISACYAQADWNYGFRRDFSEPPRLQYDNGEWIDAGILHRAEHLLVVSAVVSFGDYDFWCVVNTSKRKVHITREQIKAILVTEKRRNTLLVTNFDEDIVLKPKEIYFSRRPNDRADRRPRHSLDLLLHPPSTKLDDIADATFKRDFWLYPDE